MKQVYTESYLQGEYLVLVKQAEVTGSGMISQWMHLLDIYHNVQEAIFKINTFHVCSS
jgi:hypothetical protein